MSCMLSYLVRYSHKVGKENLFEEILLVEMTREPTTLHNKVNELYT